MKISKILIKCTAVLLCLLCLLFPFTSCSELKDFLEEGSKVDGTDSSSSQGNNNGDDTVSFKKKGGVHTVLFVCEGARNGSLSSVSVCSFDTVENKAVNFVQIPLKTYTNNDTVTISGAYTAAYSKAIEDRDTVERAREKGISALRSIIENDLCIYIDYYVFTDPAGVASIVDKLGSVEMNFPYAIQLSATETVSPGKQRVSGQRVELLLGHASFNEKAVMNLHKMIISAIYAKAKAGVSNEMLSLFVLEIRNSVKTDIPSKNGEDIFFVRQFISADSAKLCFTQFATQSCAVSAGLVEVMHKGGALKIVNEYLNLYAEELKAEDFDKNGLFNDSTNKAVSVIYGANGNPAPVYTASSVFENTVPLQ